MPVAEAPFPPETGRYVSVYEGVPEVGMGVRR